MRPDVRAVGSDVKRKVADYADSSFVYPCLKRVPLPEKFVLLEYIKFDILFILLLGFCDCLGLSELKTVLPLPPGCGVVVGKSHKQRVVLNPMRLLAAERLDFSLDFRRHARVRKAQIPLAVKPCKVIVRSVRLAVILAGVYLVGGKKSLPLELLRTYIHSVARIGGYSRIRRIAAAHGCDGQNLPPGKAHIRGYIRKRVGVVRKAAYAEFSRQRRNIKQNSRRAFKSFEFFLHITPQL